MRCNVCGKEIEDENKTMCEECEEKRKNNKSKY